MLRKYVTRYEKGLVGNLVKGVIRFLHLPYQVFGRIHYSELQNMIVTRVRSNV